MAKTRPKPHAIIFPVPYQGHINPFVNLTIKLASKGFACTFVNTQYVHHKLVETHYNSTKNEVDVFLEARKSGLDIRYKTISDGFSLDFDRDNFNVLWESFLVDFPAIMDEFVGKMVESGLSVDGSFLIADTFFPCAADVAKKYNLVHVSFWTQPALVFNLNYHLNLLAENGHYPSKDDMHEEIKYLPGVDSVNTKDFMPYLKQSAEGTTAYKVIVALSNEVKKADIILHYTLQELEPKTMEALTKIKHSYAIGPITSFTDTSKITIVKSLWPEADFAEWLDSKPPGSVLYVSLGSLVPTSKEAIEELAHGLLLSQVNFIWVVRANLIGSDGIEILPVGFKDEIKNKGLIVPWCNQIKTLAHLSVGGFLTHCGFNSTLESMWCGVPMICYPITFDQPIVRKLIVEDWKIGINLCEGMLIRREEVARNIKCLMNGTGLGSLRQEVKKLRAILQNSLQDDGSTERNFDEFIKDVEVEIYSKNEHICGC